MVPATQLADSPPARLASKRGSNVSIEPVTSRSQRDAFLRFPWTVYQRDSVWVPPLLMDQKRFLDPKRHPFYRHGKAQAFLALREGNVVGRVLASDDPNFNDHHGSSTGCFGMFESIQDQEVANRLLGAAHDWIRAAGRESMMGPVDYSTNYPCGLLIEGFDTPPRVMMNHNPPYYRELLENAGLRKARDLYAWWFNDRWEMLEKWKARGERILARGNITIRPFDVHDFKNEVRRCLDVYTQSWSHQWGFAPMTEAEFVDLAKHLKQLAIPELVLLAFAEGKPVGMSLTLPDFNEAIKPLNGRLFRWGLPIGLFQFLRNVRRAKTARLLALGVLENYRRRGICEMLIMRTLDYGKHVVRFTGAELSWTLEDNELINAAIECVGAWRYKTYRIYESSRPETA